MKLKKVKLCRFRCFGDEPQEIYFNNITALIGNNSSGKTSVLQALLKIFSENPSERNLCRGDFYLPKDKNAEEMVEQNLYIEAVFDFPELDGEKNQDSIPIFFKHFVVDEPNGKPYLRIRLEASWHKGNSIEGSIESKISYIVCPENQDIKEDDRRNINRHDLDNIRIIYVPAIRDPAKQLKNVSGTMMYHIMESVNWSEETKQQIEEKVNELNTTFDSESGVSILKDSIKSQWKNYDSDSRYTTAEMRFNNTNMDSILKKSEVVFSPSVTGRKYGIDEMGDGLRSLFYISMVDSMLEVENKIRNEMNSGKEMLSFNVIPPVLTIIALEEPENHIAPHLTGKLVNKFIDISNRENSQTIIASHSTAIIKRIEPENIRYLKIDYSDLSTRVKTINFPKGEKLEDKCKYIKEAVKAYPEIYFAKLVVLGEGDSEEIIIKKLIEVNGRNIDSSGISVVPLGGRFVNHFWRLLNDLEIPFVTLLDLDRERYGGGWGRIKYVLKQLIDSGVDKTELFDINGKNLEYEYENMQKKANVFNDVEMLKWISHLEKYDVFFSSPLDIDFMMLESFGEVYKSILEGNEGPYIKIQESKDKTSNKKILEMEKEDKINDSNYIERINNDVHCTLKENGGDGVTYSNEQKRLMIWYNYFFLNRGKPSTHYLALSKIEDNILKDNAPDVLKRMIKRIEEKFTLDMEVD